MPTDKPQEQHLEEELEQANEEVINFLNDSLKRGTAEVDQLRKKLGVTYWVIVILSVIMFGVGLALISIPIWAAFGMLSAGGGLSDLGQGLSVFTGFADLAMLFFSKPIKRIHNLMGDMAQLTLAINSFRYQLGLRLLGMDAESAESVGQAAQEIASAASLSMDLIDKHFEIKN